MDDMAKYNQLFAVVLSILLVGVIKHLSPDVPNIQQIQVEEVRSERS